MSLNFRNGMKLITEFQGLVKRSDWPVDASVNLAGTQPTTLCDGEFLSLDTSNTEAQVLKRFSTNDTDVAGPFAIAKGGNAAAIIRACGLWAVHTEVGRYDVGASRKPTILFAGAYEAEFTLIDTADIGAIGLGVPLCVSASSNDHGNGAEVRPVLNATYAVVPGSFIVGFCTRKVGNVIRAYIYANPYVFTVSA